MKEEEIKKVLRRFGVQASSRGYSYIAYGISLISEDVSGLEYITKGLYMDIAYRFNTSAACVERDIRSAVEDIWKTEDSDLLTEICGGEQASESFAWNGRRTSVCIPILTLLNKGIYVPDYEI